MSTPNPQDLPKDLDAILALLADMDKDKLLPEPLPSEPFSIFKRWFDEEVGLARVPNPNAMALATVDDDGSPSVRTVLCRGMDTQAGYVTFFTNYNSRKGRAIMDTTRVCANFHWDHAERQVRIEGVAVPSPEAESDAYFRSRRWESRLSAWVSDQSEPIKSRAALFAKVGPVLARLGLSVEDLMTKQNALEIPRPAHWGGFRIYARKVELWVGGPGRVHDRAVWSRPFAPGATWEELGDVLGSAWMATRLQP